MNEYTVYMMDEYDDVEIQADSFETDQENGMVYFYTGGVVKTLVGAFRLEMILGVGKN